MNVMISGRRCGKTAIKDEFLRLFADWDKPRNTSECPHCDGTGLAPGDGRTSCGFCDIYIPKRP